MSLVFPLDACGDSDPSSENNKWFYIWVIFLTFILGCLDLIIGYSLERCEERLAEIARATENNAFSRRIHFDNLCCVLRDALGKNAREPNESDADAGTYASMPSDASKPKTQEEKDEETLREAEAKIKELVALLTEGHTRDKLDARLSDARAKRDEHAGNASEVFHKPKAGPRPVAVTLETASTLELAEALETRIKLGGYAADLQDSLGTYARQKVEVLERKLKRTRY